MLYCGSYPPVWNLCLRRLFVLCARFLALLMCAHTHTPNASLDMDQLNFPKQNPKFKASNTIMRYYFVYRVNKFYYSPVFFLSLCCVQHPIHIHTLNASACLGCKNSWLDFTVCINLSIVSVVFFGMRVINVYNFVQQNIWF